MASLAFRHFKDRLLRLAGIGAIAVSLLSLGWLIAGVVSTGLPGFKQGEILLPIAYLDTLIQPENPRAGDYDKVLQYALLSDIPGAALDREARRDLMGLISPAAVHELRQRVMANPALIGQTEMVWLLASADADQYLKGRAQVGKLTPRQANVLAVWQSAGRAKLHFNTRLFTNADSREPEAAGLLGGLAGTALVLGLALLLVLPAGIGTAVYLEEFLPPGRIRRAIEANLSNLAAVPSIVFGLMGLAVFITFFGLPRSSALVGALVIALMLLPTIVIATRTALRGVPQSVRDAALAMGATKLEAVWHHVLPASRSGIVTGAILGLAHAMGETAPLLMIGMVAFIASVPTALTAPTTVLPVQIYLWADSPERAFAERTGAAILVLLGLLLVLSAIAHIIRRKTEQRW